MTPTAPPRATLAVASAAMAGALLLATALVGRDPGGDGPRAVLIPAYVPPRAIVDLARGTQRPRLIVVNPANGPGPEARSSYGDATRAARAAGASVLGYVATDYGRRPAADVMADVARYVSWYGVDGVFLDEASPHVALLPYYRDLARRVRIAGTGLVVVNPGMVPAPGYFDLADVVVTFEGPYADYGRALDRMPAWLRDRPARQQAHLVYDASREQALAALARGGAGYVYVTSGAPPNPWRTLPPYLREQEEVLAR